MVTPKISIIYFLIAAILGALGQYLYKSGADQAGDSIASYLLNIRLLGGVISVSYTHLTLPTILLV